MSRRKPNRKQIQERAIEESLAGDNGPLDEMAALEADVNADLKEDLRHLDESIPHYCGLCKTSHLISECCPTSDRSDRLTIGYPDGDTDNPMIIPKESSDQDRFDPETWADKALDDDLRTHGARDESFRYPVRPLPGAGNYITGPISKEDDLPR